MRKSKILYWLLAVMIIFNLIQPALVASAEGVEQTEGTELATSTQLSANTSAGDGEQTEGTDLDVSKQPSSDAPPDDSEHTTHSYANGVCTVCGEAHSPHAYANQTESGATCSVCGFVHEHTLSAGSTCETCGYVLEKQSEDVVLSRSQAALVQVDITWTAMSFTYTAGEWNPATHSYSDGGWQATESGGGQITVANTGTAAANVSFAFSPAMSDVGGSFSANEVSVAPSATQTIQFLPTGKPLETFTGGTLGTILINVQAVSNASVE